MAGKLDGALRASLTQDVAALAAYAPRRAAIQALCAGRTKEALGWIMGEGCRAAYGEPNKESGSLAQAKAMEAPLPVDMALVHLRTAGNIESTRFASAQGASKVDLFGCSPMEIVLRRGSPEAFGRALEAMCSPINKFDGLFDSSIGASWASPSLRGLGFPMTVRPFFMNPSREGLLVLAAMLGKFDQARMLVSNSLSPTDEAGWAALIKSVDAIAAQPADIRMSIYVVGIEGVGAAKAWMKRMSALSGSMILACMGDQGAGKPRLRQEEVSLSRIRFLVADGAPIGFHPLELASRLGDAALLRELFAAGGDPNGIDSSGDPFLSRISDSPISPEVAKAWLDAGADPSRGNSREPSLSTSALAEWARSDSLELVKLGVLAGARKFKTASKRGRSASAPLLAIALEAGASSVVQWLINEQGCRLEHLDESGQPCRGSAKGEILAKAFSWQERMELMAVAPPAPSPPPGFLRGLRRDL